MTVRNRVLARRILGNLDCERSFAGDAQEATSRAALELASSLATLLRVFTAEGDRLWTPLPVNPERVVDVDGLSNPRLETGPLAELEETDLLLAWGETNEARSLRRGSSIRCDEADDVTALLWSLSSHPPAPEVVAAVNHRSFSLELSQSLGCDLWGAAMMKDIPALKEHLVSGAAEDTGGRFVLKAPLSAAGRSRLILSKDNLHDGDVENRISNLFLRHGELLFEPWCERIEDFGAAGLVTPDGVSICGLHRQLVDGKGRFRGIGILKEVELARILGPLERLSLEETARLVGEHLADRGYVGPFGIDAFSYRGSDGPPLFRSLCEINARFTMGHVAHALVERLGDHFVGQNEVCLEIGNESEQPDREDGILLLGAGVTDRTTARLV